MKPTIIIASLAGLACGVVARKSQAPLPAPDDDPPLAAVSRLPRPSTGGNPDALISLSWELRGNLTSDELVNLPHGGRLLAEMTLWALKATPDELAAHWDKVIASGEDDMNTLDELMTLWVRRDPKGALDHCHGGDQEYRCFWALARVDPQMALDVVNPKDTRLFSMVLRAIAQNDPEYGLALMEKYPEHNSYTVIQGISDGLADTDPAAAVAYSALQEDFETDRLRWWLAKDPHAAFDWSVNHRALAGSTLGSLVPFLMEQDPDYFASRIAGLSTGKFKLDLLKAQAKYLAAQDPSQAFALADSQEGPPRRALMEAMGESFVGERPDLAHDLLGKLLQEGEGNQMLAKTMNLEWVKSLIEQDPIAVLSAARELPAASNDGSSGSAESQAFRHWTQMDAAASEDWVMSQEPGDRRDSLLYLYLDSGIQQRIADFEKLIELPAQFVNEDQKSQSMSRLLQYWNNGAPEELKAYINSPRASAEQREAYQSDFPKQ